MNISRQHENTPPYPLSLYTIACANYGPTGSILPGHMTDDILHYYIARLHVDLILERKPISIDYSNIDECHLIEFEWRLVYDRWQTEGVYHGANGINVLMVDAHQMPSYRNHSTPTQPIMVAATSPEPREETME